MDNKDIKELGLSSRTYNSLERFFRNKRKDTTIGELIKFSFDELITIRGIGKEGLNEIFDKVHEYNLIFDFEKLLYTDDDVSLQEVKDLQQKQKGLINVLIDRQKLLKDEVENNTLNINKYDGNLSFEILCLSNRALNALYKYGNISTIDELLNKSSKDLKSIRNLGTDSLNEILKSLHILGIKLKDENLQEENIDVTENYFSNSNMLNEEYKEYYKLLKKENEIRLKERIIEKLKVIKSSKKTLK